MTDNHQRMGRKFVRALIRTLPALGILAAGLIGYWILGAEPEEEKAPPQEPRAIKTTVKVLHPQDYPTIIQSQGIIRPHSEVTLTAEVSGKIINLRPGFEDGAFFSEGEVLLELDPSDFETALAAAEAEVARASAAYAQEQARAKQAKLNWEDLGYDEEPNDLVLRLPQLREAEANVKAAEAQLEQAKRNLERTKVRAPFDGRVRQRLVGLGQSVGGSTALGTVFSIEFAEVRLPIARRDLPFLDLPEGPEDPPLRVELKDALNEKNEAVWEGDIVRTEGALDENSLELFAIARVLDPFRRRSDQPPLRIGQPVVGAIAGRVLKNVYVLPRVAVRQMDQIYLVDRKDLTLAQRTIEPIWSDEENVVIRAPHIKPGSLLATSYLNYTPDEAKVEIIPQSNAPDTNAVTDSKLEMDSGNPSAETTAPS